MRGKKAFAQLLPPSGPVSSSTPPKSVRYGVFVNHRGPDTKKTLASSIYKSLKSMGVEVFLDEAELELGDCIPSEIQNAIDSSFLHIAILSHRYAESPWCLEELSLMLQSGQKIIPIFYEVGPSDIRWEKAFSNHEAKGRYSSTKLEEWRSALNEVSLLKGHVVNCEGDDGMLKITEDYVLKTIEDYVLKYRKKILFEVAKHPVGIDKTLQDFERSVLKSSENVEIVGITGMNGCGKTTLAKEYYNKNNHSFLKCSFIFNVRDESTKLHEKQKKLFQDLGGSKDIPFDSVEEGKVILRDYLRLCRVFIILDDVDHLDQLESLLPIKDGFQQKSVIVITSQNSSILRSWGILSNSIYKMKELNSKSAMELFCWHAFLQPFPRNEFKNLVRRFLKICSGLPLSLKVLGGLVLGKPKKYWEDQLQKVSRLLPNDIKNILKVSFDGLDEEEREIFLDISCFFIGTETDSAITVWNESGWSGEFGLETLVNKCLVEVDEKNRLRMHDQLRDFGKEISKTWSPYRLWSSKQIIHIEEQGNKSMPIRGIKVETEEFLKEAMELLRRSGGTFEQHLKILDVENNYFTEELATLSEGLLWLRLVNSPHTGLPSLNLLKRLKVLELREASELEELWSETAHPPEQLRELKISDARSFSRFPRSIGSPNHLEYLSVDSYGAPIESLAESSHLQLQRISLTDCRSLSTLPANFGQLVSLRTLSVEGCKKLTSLPTSFGKLINLQELHLEYCSELIFPSETLAQLSSLSHLDVSKCPGFTELVMQPGSFPSSPCSLKFVTLEECHVSRISISTECCPSLEQLVLDGNQHLAKIDSLPISVKHLRIKECGELSKIEGIKNCMALETLMAHTSRTAPLVQSLKHMKSLKFVGLAAACYISAFQPCLQTINRKKWPSLCTICGRAAPGVEAVVNCFTFLGLTLLHSFDRLKNYDMWEYAFLGERSFDKAAMVCLVINPASYTITLQMACVADNIFSHMRLKEGKWIFIGVFKQSSLVGNEVQFFLSAAGVPLEVDSVEMGMLAMGEENRVVDAFYKLSQQLGEISKIHSKL